MKRILAAVSVGRVASSLFPQVVKNVSFSSLELKEAYLHTVHYAENNRDLAHPLSQLFPLFQAPTLRIPGLSRGPVHAFAVSLITGVPFLLLSTYVTLTSTRSKWVLITANSVVLGMVSLGIVRLDLAISSYVLKWHQMNSVSDLTMQCLYPLAHYTFRVAEVLLRVVTFTCLFVFLRTEVVLLIMAADFFAGFAALQWHSPDKEIFRVHMVVAFSLLVVDVTYFVDQPNFVLPARSISRNVLQLRLLAPLFFFLCIWGVGTKLVWSSHLHTFTPFRRGKDVGWSGVSFRRT